MSHLRGFLYWLLTSGPVGNIAGRIFRRRCFDRLGPVALPATAKPDVVAAVLFGLYEYPERVLINRWLPADLDCVEFGSSIGVISRIILQKLKPDRQLVAVEASADLLHLAKRNVATAGFSARFKSVHGAVHYRGDHVIFQEHDEHIRGKVAAEPNTDGIAIPCLTPSKVIESNSLGIYSLVMDIEGSEFDVIAKDSNALLNCQTIIAELHGDAASKSSFIEKLAALGLILIEAKHSVFAFARSSQAFSSISDQEASDTR